MTTAAPVPFAIRPLEPGDAAAVAALWVAGSRESARHEPEFMPRDDLAGHTQRLARALEAAEILGYGAFSTQTPSHLFGYVTAKIVAASAETAYPRHLLVLDADVDVAARRRGIAQALTEAVCRHAVELGLTRVELFWLADDERAATVWTRFGFRPYLVRGCLDPRTVAAP